MYAKKNRKLPPVLCCAVRRAGVFAAFVNALQRIACAVHRLGFDRVFTAM